MDFILLRILLFAKYGLGESHLGRHCVVGNLAHDRGQAEKLLGYQGRHDVISYLAEHPKSEDVIEGTLGYYLQIRTLNLDLQK